MIPQRVARFIAAEFSAHSARNRHLERSLDGLVGAHLRNGRLAVTLRDDTLVAVCADRGLATELRFQQRELIKVLRYAGYNDVTQVRIRLASMPRAPEPENPRQAREIPQEARGLLEQAARNIEDPELAEALERLARIQSDGAGRTTD